MKFYSIFDWVTIYFFSASKKSLYQKFMCPILAEKYERNFFPDIYFSQMDSSTKIKKHYFFFPKKIFIGLK